MHVLFACHRKIEGIPVNDEVQQNPSKVVADVAAVSA
jgi:hypothetical protein